MSFRHKGLRRFYETGNAAGVQASHKKRLRFHLAALIGNRRINFEFRDGSAYVKKLDVPAAEHSLAEENVN